MATKGASNRFGSKGKPTSAINYPWAKAFNKKTLSAHFKRHGEEFPGMTKEEYEARAVKFANSINKNDCVSFIDNKNSTHKFNTVTGEYSIISKNGYVITYFKPEKGYEYFKLQINKSESDH